MIKEMKQIPVTKESHPFASAMFHCRLEELGYVEDEYFMSGTANVYREAEERKPEQIYSDAPYTTRLLVRRPGNIEAFSGNVVIEVLNASAMMDIDRMWVNSWKYFTRNGDIYIGITSKGHVVDALKKFDPERYEPINWDNPMPERKTPPQTGPFPFLSQYESGLFWDMLVDLAKLLRTDSDLNPIASYKKACGKAWLYLTGWSQSGGYVTRIVNSFAYLPENCAEAPLFDGYLAAGCGADMAPMNAYDGAARFGRSGIPKGSVMGAREPYININTESENRHVNWVGDSDQPGFLFRTYQIPGSSHDSAYNLLEYYEGQGAEDNLRFGMVLRFNGESGEPMDYPYEPIFCAAFRNLYLWVREGIPAPHAPRIETELVGPGESDDPFGAWIKNRTDAFGNAKGGIRFPAIDYPTARYQSYSRSAEGRVDAMFGTAYPLSPEVLRGLYKSLEQYRTLVEQSARECVKRGFLLEEDLEACVEDLVGKAAQRGL